MKMFTLFLFLWNLISIFNCEMPCEKLNFLGDTIQTKAVLSPIILIGKAGMKINLSNAKYKLTIEIVKTIKGSIGLWKKPIIIAGEFSTFKDDRNTCQFQSLSGVEQIYFLTKLSEADGEYQVLFNPETKNEKQLNAINKTICEGCSKLPTIRIQDSSKSNDFLVAECISAGFPPPIVKWIVPKRYPTTIIEPIDNGIRLIQPVNNSTNEFYECHASNAIGSVSHSMKVQSIVFKAPVILSRCSALDQKLCNGNGKCYNDKEENDSKFCRCNKGFDGPNCVNVSNNLPADLLLRRKEFDKELCNNRGKLYENFSTKVRYCECYKSFDGPNCGNVSNNLPADLLLRRKELDKELCNNRGKLYENFSTKVRYCECNANSFGDNCDKKFNPKSAGNEDKSLKDFIVNETSKLAAKYILIGCLIVLAGCIIVVIVLISLFKFYFLKLRRNSRLKNSENNVEINANHVILDNLVQPIPTNEENTLLLTNIKPSKTANIDKTTDKDIGYKGSTLFSGNGIYDNYAK